MFCITFLKNYKRKNKKLWGYITERYSEPCQTCKMDHFAKIVNGFQPLTVFTKCSFLVSYRVLSMPLNHPTVSMQWYKYNSEKDKNNPGLQFQ